MMSRKRYPVKVLSLGRPTRTRSRYHVQCSATDSNPSLGGSPSLEAHASPNLSSASLYLHASLEASRKIARDSQAYPFQTPRIRDISSEKKERKKAALIGHWIARTCGRRIPSHALVIAPPPIPAELPLRAGTRVHRVEESGRPSLAFRRDTLIRPFVAPTPNRRLLL